MNDTIDSIKSLQMWIDVWARTGDEMDNELDKSQRPSSFWDLVV